MNSEIQIKENKDVFAEYIVEDKTIYLHPDIKNYPKLYKSIIKHEMAHAKSPHLLDSFNEIKDLFNIPHQLATTWFLLTHPRLIIRNLLPFYKYKGDWHYNYFLIAFYSITFLTGIILGGFK